MRVDLHCHTCYSRDSLSTFDELLRHMDRRGVEVVAITDHNVIAGALAFQRRAPDRFLIGEEVKTTRGELLALFITELVPADLSLEETVDRIHAQGGLVGASHPLDRLRREAIGSEGLEAIHGQLDFLEVMNSRVILASDNRRAREKAARWGLPGSAGSDAHAPFEVGRCYAEMPHYEGAQDFLDCLAQAQIGGWISSPLVHFASTYAKLVRRMGRSSRNRPQGVD
jgi:predicted metal-dependent phosphoesterase TrpH